MAKQGKCKKCEITWQWEEEVPMLDCLCPSCRHPLARTCRPILSGGAKFHTIVKQTNAVSVRRRRL